MDLLAVVYNAILGLNAFQAFWISVLIALIVMGWHKDLDRVVGVMEYNRLDSSEIKEWKRREEKLDIALKVVGGCFIVSIVWLAITGLT